MSTKFPNTTPASNPEIVEELKKFAPSVVLWGDNTEDNIVELFRGILKTLGVNDTAPTLEDEMKEMARKQKNYTRSFTGLNIRNVLWGVAAHHAEAPLADLKTELTSDTTIKSISSKDLGGSKGALKEETKEASKEVVKVEVKEVSKEPTKEPVKKETPGKANTSNLSKSTAAAPSHLSKSTGGAASSTLSKSTPTSPRHAVSPKTQLSVSPPLKKTQSVPAKTPSNPKPAAATPPKSLTKSTG